MPPQCGQIGPLGHNLASNPCVSSGFVMEGLGVND
jgi:hypothetical protein